MVGLSKERISELLAPFYPDPGELLLQQLSIYLALLLKWNDRMNLTAIRKPEEMVSRHFGESLFAARHLPQGSSLLDVGSGAGFPGLPIQLALPHLKVTLAESQHKKASFLLEVIRTLQLSTDVWAGRVEVMKPQRLFDIVTLRAVDTPAAALDAARRRLRPEGTIVSFTTGSQDVELAIPIPGSSHAFLHLLK